MFCQAVDDDQIVMMNKNNHRYTPLSIVSHLKTLGYVNHY